MMNDFQKVIGTCTEFLVTNGVTIASIILSGIVSVVISRYYYYKANKESLKMEVIFPIVRLLKEDYSRSNYNILCGLSENYWVRYMNKKDRSVLIYLVSSYQDVSNYNANSVNAEILRSYFEYRLKQNGIDVKPVPIECEGEIVDWDYPGDVYLLRSNLKKILDRYDIDFEAEECKQNIIDVFCYYCKEYYTEKEIGYFEDYKLEEVLVKSKIKQEWSERFNNIEDAKQQFLGLSLVKDILDDKARASK